MNDKGTLIIYTDQTFSVGQDTFIDSVADNGNVVVFEDNEETGYFYAVDRTDGIRILDALHIYDVANVRDKNKPSNIKILWTKDEMKAVLSINNYYHAIFDFKDRSGYCRNGFPYAQGNWAFIKERLLTEELIEKFAKD